MLEREVGLTITKFDFGPLGGDQKVGARIAEGQIDILNFSWDSLEPLSHDPDIKARLRVAAVWNIPAVDNRASADFMFTSPWMDREYLHLVPVYSRHLEPAGYRGSVQDR